MSIRHTLSAIAAALVCALASAQSMDGVVKPADLSLDITDIAQMYMGKQHQAALDSIAVLMDRNGEADDALWYYKSRCESALGLYEEALASIRTANALDPQNSYYYEDYYALTIMMDKSAESDSLCFVMAEKFPKKFRTPYALCQMADHQLYDVANDSLAMKLYLDALALDETYAPAMLGVAETHRVSGNMLGYFTSIDPVMRDPYITPEAKCDYVDLILKRVDGRTYQVWNRQLDDMVDALAQTHPADSCTLMLAGQWFYGTGKKEKGIGYFTQWAQAEPDNFNANMLLIELLSVEGNTRGIIEACDQMLLRFDGSAQRARLYTIKGDCYYELRQSKKAFAEYERALKLDPGNMPLLNNYAYYLSLERRNLKKAEQMSRKTIEAEPDNATYLDTYGWILFLMGHGEDAKLYFKRAIIHGGKDSAAILLHYSIVLDSLGEKELAQYYRSLYENKKE